MIQLQDNNENNHIDVQFCNTKSLIMNFKIVILSYLRSTKSQEKLSKLAILLKKIY